MEVLQQVQQLRDRIKELEFENESLKCCGNCNFVKKRHCGTLYCYCHHFDAETDGICVRWTKNGSK